MFGMILFIVAPFLFRFQFTISSRPTLMSVKTKHLPMDILEYYKDKTSALAELGFKPVLDMKSSDHVPRVTGYIRLHMNHETKDMAFCTCFDNKNGPEGYVEFCTEFASNNKISTNNSRNLNPFKKIPNHKIKRYRKIDHIHELYQIHQKNIQAYGKDEAKVLPPKQMTFQHMLQQCLDDTKFKVETGYLYFDQDESVYRPTWKGAFIMAGVNVINILRNVDFFSFFKQK
jgi:hypothetical protein